VPTPPARPPQAVFEEVVADGSYFAIYRRSRDAPDFDFEWEPGEAEMDH